MRRIYGFFVLASMVLVGVLTAGCPQEPTVLQLSHSEHDFGTKETEFSFNIWITGGRSKAAFTCKSDQSWIEVTPARGIATHANNANEIVVTIDRGQFDSGTYEGTVTVSSLGLESKTFKVRASVGVTAIGLSETSHDFGPEETDWSFDVWNAGDRGTTLEFTVAPDVDWLSVDPENGTSTDSEDRQTIAVTLHRDLLEKASYSGTITVTSDRGEQKTIAITARDPVPAIGLSETSHNFGTAEITWSFEVYNAGEAGSVLNFSLSSGADWLSVEPDTGVSEGIDDAQTIQVTVSRDGLEPGEIYQEEITVSAPGAAEQTVGIVLEVAEPALAVSPHVLDFGASDTERTFQVWNPGQAGSVLGYYSAAPSDQWITVAPASGSIVAGADPDTVTVTIDRAAMAKTARAKAFKASRSSVGAGDDRIDVVVVGGTPREMGVSLGQEMAEEIAANLDSYLAFATGAGFDTAQLDAAWAKVSPFVDPQFIEEMEGLAEGLASEGFPNRLQDLVRLHMVPVVDTFSCSAIAVWGEASRDGHLYQIRNLDWELETGVQNHPWIVVYHPDDGIPHANVGFAGMLGCITGISSKGIALSEVGNSPSSEQPYDLDGEHFSTLLRKVLYDADNLTEAVDILKGTQRIKRYHYVFGDGKNERRAVKIKAHAPETPPNDLVIYTDDDPNDPVLEEGLSTYNDAVYYAGSRNPIANDHLSQNHGTYNAAKMVALSREVAMHGLNVLNAVYDATSLEMWVAFAEGLDSEAYEREYVYVDLHEYFELPTETGGTIEVTSSIGDSEVKETIQVRARTPEPAIGISANAHDFGLESTTWKFEVWNAGDAGTTLNFEAAAAPAWVSITPSSGSSKGPSDKVTINVEIDRNSLEKTITYEGAVTISAKEPDQTQDVRILARYPEPGIATSRAELNFGQNENELTFSVWNGGDAGSVLDFNIASPETWISSITPASGSSTGADDQTDITVTVDRNVLAGIEGTTTGILTFTSNSAATVTMPVSIEMTPPTAGFTASPTSVDVLKEVLFTDSSTARSGEVVEWEWDFGDESEPLIVTDPPKLPVEVTHEYESYGVYSVTLTIRSEYGLEESITQTDYIRVEPQPATAQFAVSDTTPDRFQVVNFTDKSDPGSGRITSWKWDLGDGTTSTSQNVVHTYYSHGEFTVTLTIKTTFQPTGIPPVSKTITVAQVLPDAEFSVDKKIVYTEIDPVTFTDLTTIPGPWTERIATWSAWLGGVDDMPTPHQIIYSGDYWTGTHEADITDGLYYFFFDRGRHTCRLIERSKYVADPGGPDDPHIPWYTNSEVKDSLVEVRVPSPLDIYCKLEDDTYMAYLKDEGIEKIKRSSNGQDYTLYVVKMRSQQWVLENDPLGPPVDDEADTVWEHWLSIIVPGNHQSENRTALLYVEGGNNDDPKPTATDPYLLEYALQTGHVVAAVHQVPNQPIGFAGVGDLSAHDMIAYSFARCMDTKDTFWPAVFPMAKSVVKAMTAVQEFLNGDVEGPYSPPEIPIVITDFVLAGADIQAWAVWLAGAHDERVRGLMPMAFDLINISEQIGYQAGPFDDPGTAELEFSEVWAPYTAAEFDAFDRIYDPLDGPDPYHRLSSAYATKRYRKRLEMHMRTVMIDNWWTVPPPYLFNNVPAFRAFLRHDDNDYDPYYHLYAHVSNTVDREYTPADLGHTLNYGSTYAGEVFGAGEYLDPKNWSNYERDCNPLTVTGGPRPLYGPLYGSLSYRMDLVDEAMRAYEDLQYRNYIEGWLAAMVDPAFYGERYGETTYWYAERGGRLGIPKCIISSPGSAYYVPTSVQLWLADMNGQNYFRYIPNTDHYLNQTGNELQNDYKDAFLSALPWFREFLNENGNPIVPFRWRTLIEHDANGNIKGYQITLEWLDEASIPTDLEEGIRLWTALDWNNDFRLDPDYRPDGPAWKLTPINIPPDSEPGYYVMPVQQDNYRHKAFFFEITYTNPFGELVKYTSPGYWCPPKYPGQRPVPEADFEAVPRTAAVGEPIQFSDLSWDPGDDGLDPITSWLWDFGDGTTSTQPNPVHLYAGTGPYTVQLTVTNAIGPSTTIKENYITVN